MDLSKLSPEDFKHLANGDIGELSDEAVKSLNSQKIDTDTGASYKARAVVGSRQTPMDKMTALQQYYPGAKAIDNNFVFDNPETGRPTLFNPPGMDFGDVAGGLPEIGEAVGGTLGAVGGAAAASPTGPIGAFAAGVGGAGLGGVMGKNLVTNTITDMSGAADTRSPLQRLQDSGETFASDAAGQAILPGIGAALAPVGKALVRGGRAIATSPAVMAAAARMGVDLPAGAATGTAGTAALENAVSAYPSASTAITEKYATGQAQLGTAAKDIARSMGTPGTKQEAGAALKSGAKKATSKFEETQTKLYDDAFDKIGADTPVKLNSVMALAGDIAKSVEKAPKSLLPTVGKSQEAINNILEDALAGTGEKGTIHFDTLRQVRTNIGRMLKNPQLMVSNGMDDSTMRALYGAISRDIESAANTVGGDAAKALKTADRYTRYNLNINAPALESVVASGSDEAAFNYAMGAAKDGGTRLRALRRNLPKEQWDTVSSTVFENLGRATPGQQGATALGEMGEEWSASTFLTNWNKMAPEARKALFSGRHLEGPLNDLLVVSDRFKNAAKQGNFSNTAKAAVPALAALGIYNADGMDEKAKMAAGVVLVPRLAAKLMTNPEFVHWLVKGSSIPSAKGWMNHIPRLMGIAKRAGDSETTDALNQYRDILENKEETQ